MKRRMKLAGRSFFQATFLLFLFSGSLRAQSVDPCLLQAPVTAGVQPTNRTVISTRLVADKKDGLPEVVENAEVFIAPVGGCVSIVSIIEECSTLLEDCQEYVPETITFTAIPSAVQVLSADPSQPIAIQPLQLPATIQGNAYNLVWFQPGSYSVVATGFNTATGEVPLNFTVNVLGFPPVQDFNEVEPNPNAVELESQNGDFTLNYLIHFRYDLGDTSMTLLCGFVQLLQVDDHWRWGSTQIGKATQSCSQQAGFNNSPSYLDRNSQLYGPFYSQPVLVTPSYEDGIEMDDDPALPLELTNTLTGPTGAQVTWNDYRTVFQAVAYPACAYDSGGNVNVALSGSYVLMSADSSNNGAMWGYELTEVFYSVAADPPWQYYPQTQGLAARGKSPEDVP